MRQLHHDQMHCEVSLATTTPFLPPQLLILRICVAQRAMDKGLADLSDYGMGTSQTLNRKRRSPKRSSSNESGSKRRRFSQKWRLDQELPAVRLKRLFMKNSLLHGVKSDAVRALNASISVFVMDLLQSMVSVAIDEVGKPSVHQQLKLTSEHLHKCIAEENEKFDFLVDLFSNKNSCDLSLFGVGEVEQRKTQDENETSIKKGKSTTNVNNQMLSVSNVSVEESNIGSSATTTSVRIATSDSISSKKKMALNVVHEEDFGNLHATLFEDEETDFN